VDGHDLALAIIGCHEYDKHPIQRQNTLMALIEVNLDWARDPKGYHLAEGGRPKGLRIVRNGMGPGPENLETIQPLLTTHWLFKIFANKATTAEGALDFLDGSFMPRRCLMLFGYSSGKN
jgi:hypothetical protein